MGKFRLALIVSLALVLVLIGTSGTFLVVNDVHHADIIVVLAGETDRRPARGLELLRQHYAAQLALDVPAAAKIFDRQTIDIAQEYVNTLPDRERIRICPIVGLSTKAEAHDVAHCLGDAASKQILLVTSDYHTRRAISTFRRELPGHEFFIAATTDPSQFGTQWWKHRQWAKINFDEWLRLVWWQLVDRWRK